MSSLWMTQPSHVNRQLGQSWNFRLNAHVAFHSQLVFIFRIAHCNLYIYTPVHYVSYIGKYIFTSRKGVVRHYNRHLEHSM